MTEATSQSEESILLEKLAENKRKLSEMKQKMNKPTSDLPPENHAASIPQVKITVAILPLSIEPSAYDPVSPSSLLRVSSLNFTYYPSYIFFTETFD